MSITTALPLQSIFSVAPNSIVGNPSGIIGRAQSLSAAQVRTIAGVDSSAEVDAKVAGVDTSGLVPYTGANQPVNLGSQPLKAGGVSLSNTMDPSGKFWLDGIAQQLAFKSYGTVIARFVRTSDNRLEVPQIRIKGTTTHGVDGGTDEARIKLAADGEVGVYQSDGTTPGTVRTYKHYAVGQDTGLFTPGYGLNYFVVSGAVRASVYHSGTAIQDSHPFGWSTSPGQHPIKPQLRKVDDTTVGIYQVDGTTLGTLKTQRIATHKNGLPSGPKTEVDGTRIYNNENGFHIENALTGFENRRLTFSAWDATESDYVTEFIVGDPGLRLYTDSSKTTGGNLHAGTFTADGGSDFSEQFGLLASVTGTRATAIGYDASASTNGTSLGWQANGGTGVAVGRGSSTNTGVAVGLGAVANASDAMAIGSGASGTGAHSVALGGASNAANYGVALGRASNAAFQTSIAVGHSATTTKANQLVIGSQSQPIDEVFIDSPNNVTLKADSGLSLHPSTVELRENGLQRCLLNSSGAIARLQNSAAAWPLRVGGSSSALRVDDGANGVDLVPTAMGTLSLYNRGNLTGSQHSGAPSGSLGTLEAGSVNVGDNFRIATNSVDVYESSTSTWQPGYRIAPSATGVKLGFFGVAPVARPTLSATPTNAEISAALNSLGLTQTV